MKGVYMNLAELIKLKRREKRLMQWDVAMHMGYSSPQYISNVERAVCTPPLKEARKWCEALGIKKEVYKKLYLKELADRFDGAWGQE